MTCDFMANPQSQKFNCVRKFYLTAQIFDPTAGPKGRRCQRLDPPPVRANQSDGNDGRSAPCARVGAVSGWFLGVSAASRAAFAGCLHPMARRSEEHTSELQSLMRISYAVLCLNNKTHSTETSV